MLVHVVDTAALETERDPLGDIDALERELSAYGGLADKPRLVVLNKIDVPDGRDLADIVRPDIEARGLRVLAVSAATGEGLKELTYALAEVVRTNREATPIAEPTRLVLRPRAVDDAGFTVELGEDGVYLVRGDRVERWVKQTNFDNDEAVGYLSDRLARIGVEAALAKAGAEQGAPVRIATHEFEYQPTLYSDLDYVPSERGTDWRLEEQSNRPTAAARLAARKARRERPADEDTWSALTPPAAAPAPKPAAELPATDSPATDSPATDSPADSDSPGSPDSPPAVRQLGSWQLGSRQLGSRAHRLIRAERTRRAICAGSRGCRPLLAPAAIGVHRDETGRE